MSEALINSDEDWEELEHHARAVMREFDKLPAPVRKAICDTGVDDHSAWLWLQHLGDPEVTATKLRELASTLHEQELAEAAAALARESRRPGASPKRP